MSCFNYLLSFARGNFEGSNPWFEFHNGTSQASETTLHPLESPSRPSETPSHPSKPRPTCQKPCPKGCGNYICGAHGCRCLAICFKVSQLYLFFDENRRFVDVGFAPDLRKITIFMICFITTHVLFTENKDFWKYTCSSDEHIYIYIPIYLC